MQFWRAGSGRLLPKIGCVCNRARVAEQVTRSNSTREPLSLLLGRRRRIRERRQLTRRPRYDPAESLIERNVVVGQDLARRAVQFHLRTGVGGARGDFVRFGGRERLLVLNDVVNRRRSE